jgi:hypothetical protein
MLSRHSTEGEAVCLKQLKGPQNRCPFLHGTVRCDPYPGYVQGRHPEICKNGCCPAAPGMLDAETPKQRLLRCAESRILRVALWRPLLHALCTHCKLRSALSPSRSGVCSEALEFCDLFHAEMALPEADRAAREAHIRAEIEATGTYKHSFAEIEHGARVAWRNASKCINRQVHLELQLLDCRECKTNWEMFEAIVRHLKKASAGEAIVACMSVFEPRVPDATSATNTPMVAAGPRIWNSQLVRFAGHRLPGGGVLGDPAEVEFTTMLRERFGWVPKRLSRFNVLPLVLQCNPDEPPELFTLPDDAVKLVPISHPRHGWVESLGLWWWAPATHAPIILPAIARTSLTLSCSLARPWLPYDQLSSTVPHCTGMQYRPSPTSS